MSEKGREGFETQRLRDADEAEIRLTQTQARECPQLPGGEKARKGSVLTPSDFRPSEPGGNKFLLF